MHTIKEERYILCLVFNYTKIKKEEKNKIRKSLILDYTRKEESTIIENLILNVVQRKNTSKNNSGRRLEEK